LQKKKRRNVSQPIKKELEKMGPIANRLVTYLFLTFIGICTSQRSQKKRKRQAEGLSLLSETENLSNPKGLDVFISSLPSDLASCPCITGNSGNSSFSLRF